MRKRMPSAFPTRAGMYVPNMVYVGNMEGNGIIAVNLGQPNAAGATVLVNAQSIATAGSTVLDASIATQSEKVMGRFGRGVVVVASGAATGNVSVVGRDYLGQKMTETIALNGATAVNGKKAFRYVDSVTYPAVAATTISVGTTNIFGVAYKCVSNTIFELKNNERAANAGAIIAGDVDTATATATSADVRGTYTPATVLPDGVVEFEIRYHVSQVNAHGIRQFAG